MSNIVVTAFSSKGYLEYGARMLDSWSKYNNGHNLVLYTQDVKETFAGIEQRDQCSIPGFVEFQEKWKDSLLVQGREPIFGKWKKREIDLGYSFKFDGLKFQKMVAVMHHAAHAHGIGTMIWLDGDHVLRQRLPRDLFTRWLPDDCDYSYLGREPKHSETGLIVFRLPEALPILDAWYSYYTQGTFLQEYEWHSAYLFDRARAQFPFIRGNNLTPGGSGHVIHTHEAGQWIDHLKGARKSKGRSQEAK